MAKWTSAIFTDIRNKLANNVIFSMWKGRPYFRKYVKPANPNTLGQQAWRAKLKEIVKSWQDKVAAIDSMKTQWNAIGLEKGISGFNAYAQEAQKGRISCPASGTSGTAFDVTYTLAFPPKYAKMYSHNNSDGTWTDITPSGGLSSGADQTASVTITGAANYDIWILDTRALDTSQSSPQKEEEQAVSYWDVDVSAGTYTGANITIS